MEGYASMSITSGGPCTLPKEDKRVFAIKNTNDVSDIDGARPAIRYKVYNDKPNFLDTSDIAGAQSKVLIRGRNTRDNTLYIDDIEGTRRTIKDRMMRTGRHVDPLQPNYPLPSYAPMEAVHTKFIKDPMEINDIEGTHPRQKKEYSTRDILNVRDIDGATPGLKHDKILQATKTRDNLACNDISARTHRYADKTHRVTDPNNPSYHINGMQIYDDKYTKPKESRKYVPNFSLETKDITGAQADSRYADPFPRREFRNTNFIGDIDGSHADSIRPGIKTNRQTHPLQPVYQSLDPGELLLPLIPPLIPPEMVKVPTLPAVHSTKTLSRPKTDPDMSSTWGNTGEFTMTAGHNFNDDLDPVMFGNTANNHSKPPSGNGRSASLTLPLTSTGYYGNQSGNNSAQNSNRLPSQRGSSGGNQGQQQNSIFPSTGNYGSARGNKSNGPSPAMTGRMQQQQNSAALLTHRKAVADRREEIDMVRQLQ